MKGYGSCWKRPLKNTETISQIFLDLFRKDVLCAFWNVSIWCKINDCVHNPIFCIQDSNIYTLTKKFVQKLYKIYTKIIQNTKFVYNLYTKIVQIKIFYSNEYTKNVHQIPIYIYIYKTCTKFRLKTVLNLKCIFFNVQTMCKLYKTYTTS